MRILPLALLLPLAACSVTGDAGSSSDGIGTGSGTSRTYPIADFTGIDLTGADDVDIRVGTGFSVRAEGPSTQLDRVRIVRAGDTLRIGRVNASGFTWGDGGQVKVYVTMPRIVAAASAGSGDIRIDRVDGQRFSGALAGSGSLDIAALAAATAELLSQGSGGMTVKGNVGALTVNVAGSGEVDGSGLTARSATVSVAGSGDVKARVAGPATVTVMGSGNVDLGSGAKCTVSKMGSGEVRCG